MSVRGGQGASCKTARRSRAVPKSRYTCRMRGPHPDDRQLFDPRQAPALRQAAADLRFLLSRNYNKKSAIKLVGDHFQLRTRARQLLYRAVLAPDAAACIRAHQQRAADVAGQTLILDAYNVLITVETALAGGVVVACDDGCMRDVSETHGAYRHNVNTEPALALIAAAIAALSPAHIVCYLDAPMPCSAHLATLWQTHLGNRARTELVQCADAAVQAHVARQPHAIVATSDGVVLQRVRGFDLAGDIVRTRIPEAALFNVLV